MNKLFYLIPLFVIYLTISSCNGCSDQNNNRRPIINPDAKGVVSLPVLETKPVLNVYLENSGSMDGYVNGGAEFSSIIYRYINKIDNSGSVKDSINLHYINSQLLPLGNDIALFSSKNLTPNSFIKMGGSRSSTDISDLLKQVIDRTNNDTISVLISDMIFSPGSKNDADQFLEDQKTEIMSLFTSKIVNRNLAVVAHQLSSAFNGTYFNKFDAKSHINENRLFYIFFFGDKNYIEQIQFDALIEDDLISKHLVNKFIMSKEVPVEYAVQGGAGNYRLDRRDPKKSITKARIDKKTGKLSCVINVNFKNLMLDDSYLTDINNYIIDNNYKIEEAKSSLIQDYTHSIRWSTTINSPKTLSIGLSNKIPEWVYQKNDSVGEDLFKDNATDKTYGLKYLIEGIHEPYEKISEYYAEIEVNINK